MIKYPPLNRLLYYNSILFKLALLLHHSPHEETHSLRWVKQKRRPFEIKLNSTKPSKLEWCTSTYGIRNTIHNGIKGHLHSIVYSVRANVRGTIERMLLVRMKCHRPIFTSIYVLLFTCLTAETCPIVFQGLPQGRTVHLPLTHIMFCAFRQ